MKRNEALLLAALVALLTGVAVAESDVDRALRDLGSPLLDVREEAVRTLAEAGPEAEERLFRAYARGDFRTKSLVLRAFAQGRPAAGLPLVYGDLACPDRGVRRAQETVVSTAYGAARKYVARHILPRIPRTEWRLEEALRAIPAPVHSVFAALAHLERRTQGPGGKVPLAALARRAGTLMEEVAGMRSAFARLLTSQDRVVVRRAVELCAHIRRHDVERVFLAVTEVKNVEGTYDGMFAIVRELRWQDGLPAARVLLRIVTDKALGKKDRPAEPGRPYEFLEPVSADPVVIQEYACLCLGDLGDERAREGLAVHYWGLPELDASEILGNPKDRVAYACAVLGEDEPLRALIKELRDALVDGYGFRSYLLHSALGMAYSQLGDVEKARTHFEEYAALDYTSSLPQYNLACALTRGGHIEDALEALWQSAYDGYGSDWGQVDWMERDGDLDALRKTEEYRELLAYMKRRLPPR
jgi:hypothetical protein